MPNMIAELSKKIADDFVEAATLAGIAIPRSEIQVDILETPHRPPSSLPKGKFGVYVFMFGDRCLKVGKAGPKSSARFCSQHYGINGPSTLARSILKRPSSIGVADLDVTSVKAWICENTARINFLIPAKHGIFTLSLLEAFVQCRFRPEYEGFTGQQSTTTS
jgi:hypothetical protein